MVKTVSRCPLLYFHETFVILKASRFYLWFLICKSPNGQNLFFKKFLIKFVYKKKQPPEVLCKKSVLRNFLKKSLWHSCFPVHFAKFLRHLIYRTPPDDCFCTKARVNANPYIDYQLPAWKRFSWTYLRSMRRNDSPKFIWPIAVTRMTIWVFFIHRYVIAVEFLTKTL